MTYLGISFLSRGVQAYRNDVDASVKHRGNIGLMNKIPVSVRVDAYLDVTNLLDRLCRGNELLDSHHRLPVSAINELLVLRKIVRKNALNDLLFSRLTIEPKRITAISTVSEVANAKFTSVGASVCNVNV